MVWKSLALRLHRFAYLKQQEGELIWEIFCNFELKLREVISRLSESKQALQRMVLGLKARSLRKGGVRGVCL